MKLTRNTAISLFANLGQMALGHLDDETLEAVMTNFNALRKVQEDFEELKKELFKRIYGDTEKMSEDEKKKLGGFFAMLSKMEKAKTIEETQEIEKSIKAAFPDHYDMRAKELKVLLSLLNKEVEVEIEKVSADRFIKGVLKGKKDASVHEIRALFSMMFVEEDKKGADLSELDELLNK